MNKKIIAIAIAALVGGTLNAEAAIKFDRAGTGGSVALLGDGISSTITTDVFDWAPGNILMQNIVRNNPVAGSVFSFDVYGHGALSSFLLDANTVATSAPSSEITYTFKVPVLATVGSNSRSWELNAIGGGSFEVFFQSISNSNAAAGTGFSDGQLILQGTFEPRVDDTVFAVGESGNMSVAVTPGVKPQLDQNGAANSLPAIRSDAVSGALKLEIDALYADKNFFITDVTEFFGPLEFDLDLAGALLAPFSQVDPSVIVGGKATDAVATIGANAWGVAPAATSGPFNITPNFGADNLNNNSCAVNRFPCDVMVQSDASSKFQAVETPEPATLALIGVSLLSLGVSRRRSRKAA